MPRIACIGECMIELSQLDLDAGRAAVGFAGDTANTAAYLSRLGTDVSYVTNLGQDAFSKRMIAMFESEGMDCSLIGRHETRLPGIYSIEVDPAGERSFRYWRNESAARTLFSGVGAQLADLDQFDVIYVSGITLAILPPNVRADLVAHLGGLRDAGRMVVFDTNYRPRLWPDADTARAAFAAMWGACSLGFPSFDDEQALYAGATQEDVLLRLAGLGVAEIALKNGAGGPVLFAKGDIDRPTFPKATKVVDTSGAGDSFNAGYLAARLTGADPQTAAAAGHDLALAVIAHHGALIPREGMPERP
jgi:2-dehydro-3-deoxygluconokinase